MLRHAEDLRRAVAELVRAIQYRDRLEAGRRDVSPTQYAVLETLRWHGALTLNRLATLLHMDKSTASRVVDAVERKGYARRQPHPSDGRSIRIELTAEGVELQESLEGALLAADAAILSRFEPEARRALVELIARYVVALGELEAVEAG